MLLLLLLKQKRIADCDLMQRLWVQISRKVDILILKQIKKFGRIFQCVGKQSKIPSIELKKLYTDQLRHVYFKSGIGFAV